MRRTVDTYTGKPFRWNTTCIVQTEQGDIRVPARCTKRKWDHLHPTRVPPPLLRKLNAAGYVSPSLNGQLR